MASKFVYRPEIDGLRAIAVIPVIFFHAGFSLFSGGFIGVDIFFVISGYLITSLILGELDAGTFTFTSFYERRARRILPALFLVILVCIPFAWMWMTPLELKGFASSVVSVVVFASNIIFWRQSGYFDTATELKPLLHTWSLAVEEQFYIIFPIALLLIWRSGKRASVLSIAAFAIASLVLCEYASRNYPHFNFYWAMTRAWELMAGALCAFINIKPHQTRDNALSALGLSVVVGSIFWFDSSIRFPSFYGLLPVAGACLIIAFARRQTFTAWLLSAKPFVAVGLISYSTYLWHQPLFAFFRLYSDVAPTVDKFLVFIGLSLALGWVSWRYVEIPFRRKGVEASAREKRLFVAFTGIVGFFICASGIALYKMSPKDIAEPYQFAAHEALQSQWSDCPKFEVVKVGDAVCKSYGNGPRLAVVWGDSHATLLAGAVKPVDGYTIFVIAHNGCPPAAGVRRTDAGLNSSNCERNETLTRYRDYILALSPSKVFLVGRWTMYLNGWWRQGDLQTATHFLTDDISGGARATLTSSRMSLQKSLVDFVKDASGNSRVYFVNQPLDLNFLSPRRILRLENVDASLAGEWHRGEGVLAEALSQAGAVIIDSKTGLCSGKICFLKKDRLPLYIDDNHLSPFGTAIQFDLIKDAL